MKITYTNYRPIAMWHWDVTSGVPSSPSKPPVDISMVDPDDDEGLEDDNESVASDESDYGPCAICHSDYDSACPTCKVPGDDCPLSTLVFSLSHVPR